MRLTAFVVAVTRNQIHSMSSAVGSTMPVLRRNEIACEAGVRPSRSGKCAAIQRERQRDRRLAEQLGAGPDAGAALLEDLEVVVGHADDAEADREVEGEQPRDRRRRHGGIRCAAEVADEQPGEDGQAAHRRGAALALVLGVGLVGGRHPDRLRVAVPAQEADEQRGAEQRHDEADGTTR